MALRDLIVFGIVICGGVWVGVSSPEGKRSALWMLGLSVLILLLAAYWFDYRCPGGSITDVIFLRDRPGMYYCNTRFSILPHILLIAAPIAALRAYLTKPSPPNE